MASSCGARRFTSAFMFLFVCTLFVPRANAQQTGSGNPKTLKNPVKATSESIAAGKQTFTKYCSFCHGPEAKGNGPMAPKDTHPPDRSEERRVGKECRL